MPLIIPKEKEHEWLDTRLTKEQVAEMIMPFLDDLMEANAA